MTALTLSDGSRAELAAQDLLVPDRMLLFWSSRSPYVRKVTIAAHERGVFDRLILAPVSVTLVSGSPLLQRINPLGQIPTLVTPDGRVLCDSAVIIDYLDTIGDGPALIPRDPAARIDVLVRHTQIQGMIDAMVAWRSERNRADAGQQARRDAYRSKIERVLDALERDIAAWPDDRLDLGDAALASALEYGRFRDVSVGWEADRPGLAARHASLIQRPSVVATAFRDPVPTPA